jgi:hypothetical protein
MVSEKEMVMEGRDARVSSMVIGRLFVESFADLFAVDVSLKRQ